MFAFPVLIAAAIAGLIVGITCPVLVAAGFLFFSVVFPKIPVLEIQGYLVPIRAEDFFLAFAVAMLLVRMAVYRQKPLRQPLFKPMLWFSISTLFSTLFGLAILHSVPGVNIGILYWLRGPEYFAAGFVTTWAVRDWKSFHRLAIIFVAYTALIGIYGMLQEYSIVPAFNAMHLSDETVVISFLSGFAQDRLSSTFGGPYDLAAFYLLAIPICTALFFECSRRFVRAILAAIVAVSVLSFYLTYARAPLPGLALALYVTLMYLGKKGWAKVVGIGSLVPAFLLVGFASRLQEAISDPLSEYALGNRLRTAWADCFESLWRSPLLGTGPASLHNQMGADCMYLTLLGFWGLAGFATYTYLVYSAMRSEKQAIERSHDPVQRALAIGLFAGSLGLLVNAVTVDAFLLSKIAFPYWFLVGMLLASLQLPALQPAQLAKQVARKRPRPRFAPAPQLPNKWNEGLLPS